MSLSSSFHLTRNPDDNWKFGDGLREETELGATWKEDESKGWKSITLDEIEKPYFSLVSHNPPLVSISFTLPSKGVKDTRENIKATKEFTVNIISEPFVEAANATSIDAPPDVDEFVVSGLTPLPSDIVKPPRVRESAISFECELFHFIDISPSGVTASSHLPASASSSDTPAPTNTLVLGRIIRAHIRRSVLSSSSSSSPDASSSSDGETTVDPAALRAIARLGGTTYARIGSGFELPRPSWNAEGRQVTDLLDGKGLQVGQESDGMGTGKL
ncbi:hypothetical protein ACEPAI_7426 [Sanghuangporus weigelae]